jgi:hypothetical protein
MRRHLLLGLAALLVLSAAAARSARAQDLEPPRERQGYWVGAGAFGVAPHLNEEGSNRGFYPGYGFTFRFGQLLTERLGLGLQIDMGTISKGSDKGALGGLIMEGSARLWRNLSAHAGLGIGYVDVSDSNSTDKTLRGGAGSYYLLGASYDFFPLPKLLTGGWALTPTVDFYVMPDGNIHTYTFFAGLQILRWLGFSRDKLLLPEE